MDTLRALFIPISAGTPPAAASWPATTRGVDTVLGYFGRTIGVTGGSFRVEVHDVVANDEHGVGLNSVHAEREGRTLEDNTLVFHVRDGKVTEAWQYWADQYAADDLFG